MSNGTNVSGTAFFGHPRGLGTLFFTEMWERFSYYGMRALLILFMVDAIQNDGLGFDTPKAAAIYGIYTSCVYLFALPGGWLADNLFGQRKAIWYGGILIASGHFCMAIPTQQTFFLGLILIVLGTGMLKPNISAIVGGLYPEGGARRDAGFSVFYMGINVGAFSAPLICSWLGETYSWHYGFAAAGIGMVCGLIQYKLTDRHLLDIGLPPHRDSTDPAVLSKVRNIKKGLAAVVFGIVVMVGLAMGGVYTIDPIMVSDVLTYTIIIVAFLYFVYLLIFGEMDATQRKRVGAIAIFWAFHALFWSAFEQAGSSLNLFASEFTDRIVGSWEIPAGFLQSVNPVLIILLAPVFAVVWVKLAKIGKEPPSPLKFAFGLVFVGLGFGVMVLASQIAAKGGKPLPTWLILTYFLHTVGELAISPVGLSMVTKLAPKKYVSALMGVWFISIALGNLIAGRVAGHFDPSSAAGLPSLFTNVTLFCVISGIVIGIFNKPIRALMSGIK